MSNNVDAVRLYERLGFVVEGRKEDAVSLDGQYVDMIEMVKKF